jgi:hypothetical protein
MTRLLVLGFCIFPQVALAMVGGAPPADIMSARHVVLLVGSGGTTCTGSRSPAISC